MKVNKNVIHRCVAGEDLLVPIGEAAGDMNGLYILTPTGGEIWDMLAEGKSMEEIVCAMSEDYGVEPEIIRADVLTVIEKLKSLGLILDD